MKSQNARAQERLIGEGELLFSWIGQDTSCTSITKHDWRSIRLLHVAGEVALFNEQRYQRLKKRIIAGTVEQQDHAVTLR